MIRQGRWWGLLFVLSLLTAGIQGQDYRAEIVWDTWGVPHIYAEDTASLMYAFGWAQAHQHGDLILRLYGEARGQAAEYWGESYLASDVRMRTVGVPHQGREGYERLPLDWQANLSAFAEGINDYVATNSDMIDPAVKVVLPLTGVDIMAHGVRVMRYEFLARRGMNTIRDWEMALLEEVVSGEIAPPQPEITGSNAWAIGPSRSASGHAMLVANPHQPWFGFGLWIEAHLVAPGINAYGAALVGQPVLGIAFNESLGWSHTVNTHDTWDLYRLTLAENGYVLDGEILPFDERIETLRVQQEDGTLITRSFTVYQSEHGPVLALGDAHAFALRVASEQTERAILQWWEMATATNLAEFETALSRLGIPMFTVMYADRDGNILMLFNTQSARRDFGDWDDWMGWRHIGGEVTIVPGDTRATLWAHDYHPYEELPKLINPASGWLQNANEPPWTATLPLELNPADYPAYIAPEPYVWPRPTQSMRLMMENEVLTFDQLRDLKFSTEVELARQLLDDLIRAARAQADDALLQNAADVLEAWDRRTDADSVGAVLFTAWVAEHIGKVGVAVYAEPFDITRPLETPRGLADPELAVERLRTVAVQLEALRLLGGGIDVAYGDVFRLRYGPVDLPANGGDDFLGTFSTLTFIPDEDLRFRPVQGDSYIAVVEFSDPIRAEVLLTYGNSTQAGSPFVGDQLDLFRQKRLRTAWFTREQVEANMTYREVWGD